MTTSSLQGRILSVLNSPAHRGRWLDTRMVAHKMFQTDWADQDQVGRVRRALVTLETRGDVVRAGYFAEWRSAKHAEVEAPEMNRAVAARLAEMGVISSETVAHLAGRKAASR